MKDRAPDVTLPQAWDEIQVFLTGPVVVAGTVPGLLLCVPGLAFFGAAVILPLVAFALLLLLLGAVGAVLAAPVLLVRALVRAYRRRTPIRSAPLVTRSST
jgi:hypothetical protein